MSPSVYRHPVAVSAFMICRGLCACTEMLWMCVLYVSFGSKVRPITFGCVAMGSALLFIVRSRLLVYSAGSGVNRVQVVCLDLVRGCFVLSRRFSPASAHVPISSLSTINGKMWSTRKMSFPRSSQNIGSPKACHLNKISVGLM